MRDPMNSEYRSRDDIGDIEKKLLELFRENPQLVEELQRGVLNNVISEAEKIGIVLDRTSLDSRIKSAVTNIEQSEGDRELSLAELETVSGGLGLSEVLVSAVMLAVVTTNAAGLFARSQATVGDSSNRAAVQAVIAQDMEMIRMTSHEFAAVSESATGMNYAPDEAACTNPETKLPALGEALMDEIEEPDEELSQHNVTRTVEAEGNSIEVTYKMNGKETLKTKIVPPAEGWCS